MASKKRQSKKPSSGNRARGGRFASKADAAIYQKELKERAKDKAFLRRSMKERLDQLKYPKAKRKRVEDTRQVSTAILERRERYLTKTGKKRKTPLGSRTVGGYRLTVKQYSAPMTAGRQRAHEYIAEKTKRGDIVWVQIVTPNGVSTGTVPDTGPGAIQQLDRDVLTRKYINFLANRELRNYRWEIVIQRKIGKSKKRA